MRKCLIYFLCLLAAICAASAQESDTTTYKNQVTTNLFLPIFESFDLSYERVLGNKFALGISGAIYGERIEEISLDDTYGGLELRTKYELMPFARIYFGGNQRKSHFLEVFGSISGVDEKGRLVRSNTDAGFGVYTLGTESYTRGGVGLGYGYRFLFLEGRLVAEAQFGVRTNFDVNFVVLNAAFVRTGIKIGYRF